MKKRKYKVKKIIVTLILVILIIFGLYFLISSFKKENKNIDSNVISEIKDYGYVLDDNKSKLYNSLFKSLEDTLNSENVDEEDYAVLISKLFIADFYNLDNKITNSDIGGVQFIYDKAQENFIVNAQDTIYKYIESDIDNDRKQELPIVTSIEVDAINNSVYKYDEETYDSYEIELTWKYKKDLEYPTTASLILIYETEKKLAIVEIN